ncbi:MAG: CheR family methyltransferase [Bacteroidota bacterium]
MKNINRPIIELLIKLQGVDVSKYNDNFLNSLLQKRITETNSISLEGYFAFFEHTEMEQSQFVNSLYVSYSEFFRNSLTFSVLEQILLPKMLSTNSDSTRKELRIWSAACAAGQEAYSLAILLDEITNGGECKKDYRIFATDQDSKQVNEAQNGMYSVTAVYNMSMLRVNQQFENQNGCFYVKEKLKKNIHFSVFDLFDEQYSCPPSSIFGDFDIVVCSNLLYYYKPEFQKRIIEKVVNSLTHGGYLITSETERDIFISHGFNEVYPQSAIFQKNKYAKK